MSNFNSLDLSSHPNTWRTVYNDNMYSVQQELLTVIHANGSVAMNSTFNMSNFQIVFLGAGTLDHHAVNVGQLNAVVDKFTANNELYVHPSLNIANSRCYTTIDTALKYLNDNSLPGAGKEYIVRVKHHNLITGYLENLTNFAQGRHIQGDVRTLVRVNNNLILDGTNAKLSNLVLKFLNTGGGVGPVSLRGAVLHDCIVIVSTPIDLEFRGVIADPGCVFIVQSGNNIVLAAGTLNKISGCDLSQPLTGTGINYDSAMNTIDPSLQNWYPY